MGGALYGARTGCCCAHGAMPLGKLVLGMSDGYIRKSEIPVAPPAGTVWHFKSGWDGALGYLALYPGDVVFGGSLPLRPGELGRGEYPLYYSICGTFVERARGMRGASRRVVRMYRVESLRRERIARMKSIVTDVGSVDECGMK